ncbi:methionyl-tRNA formyltransferase [Buchnera aphidicola]|uniref:methionyl-tRNA formyltransferase n=1 Tax=Buchnera aphidicola TaxID=9 RepID=UPI003464307C
MKKLKIIFAGTSNFSAQYLKALLISTHQVVAVITRPDLPSGRGQKIHFSPVKILSQKKNIPILQPLTLNEKTTQKKILDFNADIMIVVAYGKIIPKEILTMFPKNCINIHASLLPRWRGATPIQSAILFGDQKTGISIIKMNEKIDTGNIIYSIECKISPIETAETLTLKLIKIGVKGLLETLNNINKNIIFERKQNEKYATFTEKIHKKDGLINWNRKASTLDRLIRAFNPRPVCYFIINKIAIRVWEAKIILNNKKKYDIGEIVDFNKNGIQINTIDQILNIQKIQFPGKKIVNVEQIMCSKKNLFTVGKII